MEEIWKDIPDTKGYYQVSNFGSVRVVDRDIVYSNGTIHHHRGRMIKPSENGHGYLQVHFNTSDGRVKTITIHKLVALLFVDGYADGLEVNHKDENKHNNRADNLEWCTREYNSSYGTAISKRVEKYKKCSWAKRTKIIVVYKDGVKVGEFNGYKEAGEALGVTGEYLSFVANGQRKSRRYKVEIKRPRSYQVGQYKDGKLIAVHSSLSKAAKAIGVKWNLDRRYIGTGKIVHGYTLKEIV